jgi:hemin uptake protein HemP
MNATRTRPASPAPPSATPAGDGAAADEPEAGRRATRRLDSAALFGNQSEIEIEHGQAIYRLRLTALGKLILTK